MKKLWKQYFMKPLANRLFEWCKDNDVKVTTWDRQDAMWLTGDRIVEYLIHRYGEVPDDLPKKALIILPSKAVMAPELRVSMMLHECVHAYRYLSGSYNEDLLWFEEFLAYYVQFYAVNLWVLGPSNLFGICRAWYISTYQFDRIYREET